MATMNIGSLVVDLIAESAQYIRGLQEADQETRRWSRQVSDSFSRTTKSIAGLTAGFLSVGAAMSAANAAMANAKEIENMAGMANMSAEEFQAATYAVDQYGISAEKLGDISKDVSDKLGDFIATGGGEFADFFENVAPKVGLTAQELQGLAGPDALIAVKKAMDDANISMEEQIFYLESIASDASLLIPILEKNGKGYRDLTQDAHEANLVMSQADISALRESEKIISSLSKQMSTAFAGAVAGSAEQLNWLAEVASGVLRQIGNELDALNDIPNTIEGSIEKIADMQEEIDGVSSSINRLEKNQNAYNREPQLAALRARLARLKQEIKEVQESRWELQAEATITIPEQPEIQDIKPKVILVPEVDQTAADKAAQDIITANQKTLDSLTRQLATEEELINLNYQKQVDLINSLVLNEAQIKKTGYDHQLQLQSAYLLQAEAARQESLDQLKDDSDEATDEMVTQMEKLAAAIGTNTETMEKATTSWANSFSTEFANMVTQGEMDFSRLAESIINDLIRIAVQANITDNLIKSFKNWGSGDSGGDSGSGATPELATGGPVMRGSTYLVGEKGPELFTASNSGSIIPNNQMSGGNTTVNVYTQPGETAETRTRSTSQGDVVEIFMKQVDSRLNEQISRGQGLARTLEGRYSLNRKSY